MAADAAFFAIFEASPDKWYWRLKGANGEPMAISEAYPTKQHAERGVADAAAAAIEAENQPIRIETK